jgi:thymidylate synthase
MGLETVLHRQISKLTEIAARIFGFSAGSLIAKLTEIHVYEVYIAT